MAYGSAYVKCRFCKDRVARVDYKDVRTLHKLNTPQRQVKRAVKRARFLALLPYVGR